MSRRRRPRGRPSVPVELTPRSEWDTPSADEPDPDPVATQPLPPSTEMVPAVDPTALTADLAAALGKRIRCSHCGGHHLRACPRVREMRFHADGALAAVVFWRDGQWSDDHVLWPDEIAAAED